MELDKEIVRNKTFCNIDLLDSRKKILKILTKKFVITFYITTFASDNKRFLCLFVKFVLYRGPVLWEKHWTFFCIYTSRRCSGVYFFTLLSEVH